MIFLIDTEKTFDKFQNTFMFKTLSKLGLEGNFLNLIRSIGNILIVKLNGPFPGIRNKAKLLLPFKSFPLYTKY